MSKILELLKNKKTKLIDFPEFDDNGKAVAQVIIKLLDENDHEWIQVQAAKETDTKLKDDKIDQKSPTYKELYDSVYNNIASRYVIYKMCLDPENKPFSLFTTVNEVGLLLPAQIEYFHIEYQKLRNGNPTINVMTNEDLEKAIVDIHNDLETGASFLEHRLLPIVQVNFLLYLIEALWKSRQRESGLSMMADSLHSQPSSDTKIV